MFGGIVQERQRLLIENNREWLRQAQDLLGQITDAEYTASPPEIAPHRVGGHLRHILEFYECFLDGLRSGHIDYDARKRYVAVETNRLAARAKLDTILQRLDAEPLDADPVVWVRLESAGAGWITGGYAPSSVGRELQLLSSHTIHHFALIALNLRAMGLAVDVNFGMAPSTLRYLASQRQAEAA